jgi:hypothetical protein
VLHNVFDHTSIIKTILERFAPGFAIADVFGPRAAAANDLLADLRQTARVDKPEPPGFECTAPIGPVGPAVDLERFEYHTAMRLLGVPETYRARAVV